jgi:hypothetical protein
METLEPREPNQPVDRRDPVLTRQRRFSLLALDHHNTPMARCRLTSALAVALYHAGT